ncbi:MAG: hypothetical protein U0491_02230 [Candidatus Saccharimonadales bacterium]
MASLMWDGDKAVWDSTDFGRLKKHPKNRQSDTDIRKLLFKGRFSRIGDRIRTPDPSRR